MEYGLLHLCNTHSTVFRKVLVIFLAFLPVLTIQNNDTKAEVGDGHPLLQWTNAVSRCLFNCGCNMTKSQDSHPKDKIDSAEFINELRASYGNITGRLEGLSKSHTEILQHIKSLNEKPNNNQDLSGNKNLTDLSTSIESLKNEVKALVAAHKETEESMLNQKQLSECKESLANIASDMKVLQLIVRERLPEVEVVRAVRENDLNKLRVLLDAGMKVDSRDKDRYNNTALHMACLDGHLDMIRFLVKKGAALESRNTDNNTPLIDAVVGNKLPAVQLMVELGGNPLAEGWHGETPRKRAERNGYTEVAKWLEQKGW